MNIICKLFGHKAPVYAERGWWSPGEQYAKRVTNQYMDNIHRVHADVIAECPRCGKEWKICKIHIPRLNDTIKRILEMEKDECR